MSLDLKLAALQADRLPFALDTLPQSAYFVGGAVRDALLRRERPDFDIDIVLAKEAIAVARQLADRYQGGFVVLDEERQIARVVLSGGTIDIAQQVGKTLETDLKRRDFRINAIAYNPHTQQLFDPLKGIEDLEAGVVRMVTKENLADDPLRLLRAYRQAAQLDFTIKPKTRNALRRYAPRLKRISGERVRQELNLLLNHPQGLQHLKTAVEDGVLSTWLPNLRKQGTAQMEQVEQVAWLLGRIWIDLDAALMKTVGQKGLSRLGLAKLACGLAGNPDIAEKQLMALKYSRAEIQAIRTTLAVMPELLDLIQGEMDLATQYFFFQKVGAAFPIVIVLAVAIAARQELLRETRAVGVVAPLVNAYLDPESQVAHPTPIVSGTKLIEALSLEPSPQIGTLLTEIHLARLAGQVQTPEAAIAFAKSRLNTG
ncbi:MAG: CCA tRNA nucleotidyltransferase [Spirulina sp. SIO3F2]|nr:CCA tRNA nucleotidyltransferase [Spirulina sp. SIO3F2]